jgi:hypothetical protein
LKLTCDVLLSNSAFEFNLRRYTVVAPSGETVASGAAGVLPGPVAVNGREVQVDSIKTRVESAPGFSA